MCDYKSWRQLILYARITNISLCRSRNIAPFVFVFVRAPNLTSLKAPFAHFRFWRTEFRCCNVCLRVLYFGCPVWFRHSKSICAITFNPAEMSHWLAKLGACGYISRWWSGLSASMTTSSFWERVNELFLSSNTMSCISYLCWFACIRRFNICLTALHVGFSAPQNFQCLLSISSNHWLAKLDIILWLYFATTMCPRCKHSEAFLLLMRVR